MLLAWMPQGRTVIVHKVQEWTLMVGFCKQAQKHNEFFTLDLVILKKTNIHIIVLAAVCPDSEDPGCSSVGCWSHSTATGPAV